MKQLLLKLWKKIKSHFYLYDWMKPIVCKYFGHKTKVQFMVYEQEKLKNKNGVMMSKHRYDPYYVYSCSRCGKKLGTKRLKRKLTKLEAQEYAKQIKAMFQKLNAQKEDNNE